MAQTSVEELITDVKMTVDEADYADTRQLGQLLGDYRCWKTGSFYKVTGSHQEIEDLFMKLCTLRPGESNSTSNNSGGGATMHGHLPEAIKAAHVAAPVLEYIKKRHCDELDRIKGEHILTEEQASKDTENITLIFKPRDSQVSATCVCLARERFVTFYQRVASNLHVENLSIAPHHCKDLQRDFPQLLITPQPFGATVSGSSADIGSLECFLQQSSSSSSDWQASRKHEAPRPVSNNQLRSSSTANSEESGEEELCAICRDVMSNAVKQTLRCTHSFCRDCLKTAFDYKPVCPTCGALYGTLKGTQPEGGTMRCTTQLTSVPGYEGYGTITVDYYIPSGIQKAEHPNPGERYEGASRIAYLPDSPEGRRVRELLQRAFDLRLIFTVGQSVTSGRNNVVTWNDIHHKTCLSGGSTWYGYPDPDYLKRVQDELKLKGVE